MSLRINFNLSSVTAQRSLGATQDAYARTAERLATGLRINRASDDSAGMAVSERLRNQVRGLGQASRNAQDAIGLVQIAEGAMAETHRLLGRMRELAVQASNDTLSSSDRANLQTEVNQLVSEVDRIASATNFNGINLLDKNSAVSLHNAGSGLSLQLGADSGSSSVLSSLTISAVRAEDLGDVASLSSLDSNISTGAYTFSVGASTGLNYNAAVDTIFDLRDTINAVSGTSGVTATVTGGALKLDSGSASATVTADTGALLSSMFGTYSPTTARQTATTGSTIAELGISAGGSLSFVTDVAAGSGGASSTATLAEIGVTSSGTIRVTATVASVRSADQTVTAGEMGSTSGTFRVRFDNAAGNSANPTTVDVSYTADETLDAIAIRTAGLLYDYEWPPDGGSGDLGVASTADFGSTTAGTMTIDIAPAGSNNTDKMTITDVTGTLASLLGLTGSTKASQQQGTGKQTAAQTETIDVAYTASDTIEAVRARVMLALGNAGDVAYSTIGSLAGATATYSAGVLAIASNDSDVSLAVSDVSGTLASALGLSGTGATVTGSAVNTAAQTETVTVAYATTDTLGTVGTRIQTALRSAGAVGNSTTGTLAGSGADFGVTMVGGLSVDVVDSRVTLTTIGDTGGLLSGLNVSSSPAAAGGTTVQSSSVLQETNYTLVGSAYTSGVSSISSGNGSTLVISTQTDAAAAIATIDLAVDQVSAARANLGALQSRLESAARTIAVATENAAASNSRITDADIAEAMSDLVRTQVLQQAGISMLAQANQSPSLVLQLLR